VITYETLGFKFLTSKVALFLKIFNFMIVIVLKNIAIIWKLLFSFFQVKYHNLFTT